MKWFRRAVAEVDVTDVARRLAIQEAIYQADADAQSKVLRISGKPHPKGRAIPALVERRKA